ncbi:AraC family transcriptional regulator [Massilia sp. SM-13]|uniref:AraC family transcriptional regulator n=1 Tax=Pseudoduganella rhizocola TaxID=3382643 RepID=UPI0038B4F767
MDTLSRLLSLYPVDTVINIRCHFRAPWLLDLPASGRGTARYHLLAGGEAVLEGDDGSEIALQAGDALVFPHGGAHRIRSLGEGAPLPKHEHQASHGLAVHETGGDGSASDILCGEFHFGAGSEALLAALPDVLVVRTAGQPAVAGLRSLIAILQEEAVAERPGSSGVLQHLSAALFALMLRAWMEQTSGASGILSVLAEKRLQPALQGMLAAPGRDWTLETLAAACHLSRATFARLFSAAAGVPPATMLTHIRMTQAAQLLSQRRLGAAAVGELVGYQSEAAFHRAFHRHHGVGPGQFRRAAGANKVRSDSATATQGST